MSRSVSQASDLSRFPHATSSSSLLTGANTGMLDHPYQDDSEDAQHRGGHARLSAPVSRLPGVNEDPLPDFGQSPMDFIMSTEDDRRAYAPASFLTTYYTPNHTGDFFQYPTNPFTSFTSATPSLVSVDSAAVPDATPLTRENSSVGGSFVGSFGLTRLDSTSLPIARTPSHDPLGLDLQLNTDNKRTMATGSEYLFDIGVNLRDTTSYIHPKLDGQAPDMHRSTSNTSTKSTASNQERRAKEARERQVQNGLRTSIAPKPSASPDTDAPAADLSPTHAHSARRDGNRSVATAPSKTQYQRPKHPKVKCLQCNDHPDGFRGEHELRRHTNSKHSDMVDKWVCRDPSEAGIKPGVIAINPLSKCKACQAKKPYGAYYNAAAHLRRAHFRKRPVRGRAAAGSSTGVEETERRAGKGGGDWPPMSELKHWMCKVQVPGDGISSDDVEDDNGSGSDDIIDHAASAPFGQDIGFMTYGNGGALDYSELDDASPNYPTTLPELTIDTADDSPADMASLMAPLSVGGTLSPFSSSVSSLSPLQQDLDFHDDAINDSFGTMSAVHTHPTLPIMENGMDYPQMDDLSSGPV